MKILVGYIPTPEGVAAVDYAMTDAKHNDSSRDVPQTWAATQPGVEIE